MFRTTSPEEAGISSSQVLDFIKTLERYHFNTHSIIMARGNNIFAEAYYAPINESFQHRMYSVSKSFTAIAVGFAEQDGLLSLDDFVMKYFSEYRNENTDALYEEMTIRDLLTMRTCMADKAPDYWGKPDRVKAYFDIASNQVPGTNFSYDSTGAFLLTCIVEKLTGKPFLEYLKDKVLREIGFSEDSYCLLAPGGHSHGDSGVMCTTRDLLTFARFVLNRGQWDGKQYLNRAFIDDAISKQTDNDTKGRLLGPQNYGYGYLIWKAPDDGFAFIGMADQLAICDPKTDFVFVITSENMAAEAPARFLIYHELYKTIIHNFGEQLPENHEAHEQLKVYLSERTMFALSSEFRTPIESIISGKQYMLKPNPMGITSVKVTFHGDKGEFEYINEEGINKLSFGMGYNVIGRFPGKKRMSQTASVYEDGTYVCGASAAWAENSKLHIMAKVIDSFMGTLNIVLGFKGNEISVEMSKYAQRILEGMDGHAVGRY